MTVEQEPTIKRMCYEVRSSIWWEWSACLSFFRKQKSLQPKSRDTWK